MVALAALFLVTGAQAVHDLGLFELDRNAQNSAAVPGDDWNSLPGSSKDFTGILEDISLPGDQFQGGGSKDDLDITSWLWKTGEPLDKDDITNAYAAAYDNTVDTGQNNIGDLIVYFGLDRFSTAGSAQVGFWFLQDPDFGLTNDASGGGFKFSGQHQNNDILVQSNFTNGGVISNLTVYKWLNGSLVQITGVNASDCVGPPPQAADDAACATVNQLPTPAPWPYTPKANEGPPGTFQTSAFFEGGLNVTRLVPDATCFANFVAETRSSTPFDARLKDFVQGQFENCEATIETTPSDASIQLGDPITDSAVVRGSGLNAPTPTGFVKFFICSPAQLTNGTCATGTGTFVDVGGDEPDGEALTPDPNDATQATAESDAFTPNAVGTWCWRGEYSGDDFYDPVTDSTTGECFTVTDTSSLTTAQNWRPNDSATITSAGGSTLDGSVTFTLYNSSDCTGTVLYTETVDIPAGTASPVTKSTTNDGSSPGDYLATADATVSWKAHFDSDDPNVGDSTPDPCELSTLDITN
jgi:hypothetical protein